MIRVQVPAPSCDQRFIDYCNLGPILFIYFIIIIIIFFCVFVFLYYVHSIALENGVVLDYNSC